MPVPAIGDLKNFTAYSQLENPNENRDDRLARKTGDDAEIATFASYNTRLKVIFEGDAMLRYLHKGQIQLAYIPRVLVKMRVGGESNKSLKKIMQKSREDMTALRNNGVGGFGTLVFKNLSKIKQFF